MIEANGKISGGEHRERNDSISLSSVKKKFLDSRENTKMLNSFSRKKRGNDSFAIVVPFEGKTSV